MKNVLIYFSMPFLLYSCSIEKRYYLPGYHIEWKNRSQVEVFQKNESQENESQKEPAHTEPISVFKELVLEPIITDQANQTFGPIYKNETKIITQEARQEFKSEGKKQKQFTKKAKRPDGDTGEIILKTLCVILALFGIGWLAIIICGGGRRELFTFFALCALAFGLLISTIFLTPVFTIITAVIVLAFIFYVASIIYAIGVVFSGRFD